MFPYVLYLHLKYIFMMYLLAFVFHFACNLTASL